MTPASVFFSSRSAKARSNQTAAATTGPASGPRPASSTPATKRRPASQASLSCSSMACRRLADFLQTSGFAGAFAQIVQLRAADGGGAFDFDLRDVRGVERKHAFDAFAEGDAADGEGFVGAAAIAGDDGSSVHLDAFLVAFADFHVHADGVTNLMIEALDPEKMDYYIEENYSSKEYMDIMKYFYSLKDNYPDIYYLYVYSFYEADPPAATIIIDLEDEYTDNPNQVSIDWVGSTYIALEPFASLIGDLIHGKESIF